ncbi:hypothetical protein FA10DRAFT_273710 [Acaromyces ingoldii]|uniref:DUF92-domain-containing protein n=1 Tax=Acaromyces ingoldii TaxID=215250 RepID=A0A316YY06_9BASI|nr:hypothetical protein FA10DRAFT_273710 [Acaromyces ingoldii]PWN92963.1 hypothetical protein FA10DRAFT_273710 [Acaromyces ingoldii]
MAKTKVYPVALALAILLSLHGYRKGSLAVSGALAAFTVGYLTLANPVSTFGTTLLFFYLVGSRATKVGSATKAKLEREGEEKANHKSKQGGQRDAWQVFCNSATAVVASVLFRLLYVDDVSPALVPGFLKPHRHSITWQSGKRWCLLLVDDSTSLFPWLGDRTGAVAQGCFLAMLGHFACCMGDTLASELGILSRTSPRLILPPFAKVPPGTNGGQSLVGTVAALAGGTLIGLFSGASLLFFDNAACQTRLAHGTSTALAKLVFLGSLAGLAGSTIDSLLGATLQRTWYNTASKQVLVGGRLPKHEQAKKGGSGSSGKWQVITGRDVLSNNAVNLVSSVTTALLTVVVGRLLFSQ